MKKLLLLICMLFIGNLVVQAQGLNYHGKKVEFTFPTEITSSQKMLFPTFETKTPAYADTVTVSVNQFYTYVKPATLTGTLHMIVSVNGYVTPGAMLWLEAKSDTVQARNVTFGTGFTAPTLTGDSAKTRSQYFIYNGTKFIAAGAPITH